LLLYLGRAASAQAFPVPVTHYGFNVLESHHSITVPKAPQIPAQVAVAGL
jgi:hypothetical protein